MVKIATFFWTMSVFYSIFPGSNPLNIIFSVIFISSILFLLFAYKGGSSMGFLWVLVYLGGMMIVFLYLIFLTLSSKKEESLIKFYKNEEEEEKISFFYLILMMSSVIFFFFKLNFSGGGGQSWASGLMSFSSEVQEYYSLFMSISCKPIFGILLLAISMSLFLYLGILNKKTMQSKISFFFHFITKNYMKFPILSSL